MDMTCDKILIIAKNKSKETVTKAINNVSGLEILEADSENKAFELIYTHDFVLTIVDETLDHIDTYKIGSMLLSHKATHNIPLIIITNRIQPDKFLNDFKALQVDYIEKPFGEKLIQARIQIFFDLFRQKKALSQSMTELEIAYKKVVLQSDRIMHQEMLRKESTSKAGIAATQMQQALPILKSSLLKLLRQSDIQPGTKANLTTIKTAAENISHISSNLLSFKEKSSDKDTLEHKPDKPYKLMYVQGSDEEYNIFNHCLKDSIAFHLIWARTMDEAIGYIAKNEFDLIFTDHLLPGASGFDLLSRLKQMRANTPVIFAFSKQQVQKGSQAISKGAFNFFIKEEISEANLIFIIKNTLQKARISRQAEDAMNRIVMVAQKDTLTRLYTLEYFEKMLGSEIAKSKRYSNALSILIIHFDTLDDIYKNNTPETGNAFLSTSAALIQSMIRISDMACRYTKEQFALILPNTDINGAGILAQRINKKIGHYKFISNSKPFKLTVSIGGAQYQTKLGTSDTQLVDNAQNSMTSAVNQGGNTITLFNNKKPGQ